MIIDAILFILGYFFSEKLPTVLKIKSIERDGFDSNFQNNL